MERYIWRERESDTYIEKERNRERGEYYMTDGLIIEGLLNEAGGRVCGKHRAELKALVPLPIILSLIPPPRYNN